MRIDEYFVNQQLEVAEEIEKLILEKDDCPVTDEEISCLAKHIGDIKEASEVLKKLLEYKAAQKKAAQPTEEPKKEDAKRKPAAKKPKSEPGVPTPDKTQLESLPAEQAPADEDNFDFLD